MDVRQLEIFAAVAEEGGFTRAAQRLFAAQSTVSAAVKALEDELGAALFERSTRSVELTAVGEAALVDARAALDAVDRMRSTASQSSAGLRGRVRLGIFTSLEFFDLPGLLGRFHRAYPLVNLRLVASPTGSTGLLDDVRRGRLDIALVALPEAELGGVDALPIGDAPYVVLLPDGHRLAGRDAVSLGDLAEERFVDTPAGFGNRVLVDRAYEALGSPRSVVAEVADLVAVPRYVREGLGVAVLPAITPLPEGIVAVPLEPPLDWRLSAVSAKKTSPAVSALRELLRAQRSGLRSADPASGAPVARIRS